MEETIRGLKLPLLVLHSPQDTTVGIENAAQIYQAAWHPKSFISLDGADHLLSLYFAHNFIGFLRCDTKATNHSS